MAAAANHPRRSSMSGGEAGQVTGTPDKDYNIIWVTEQCLSNVLRLEPDLEDPERAGGTGRAARGGGGRHGARRLLPPRQGREPQGRRGGQGAAQVAVERLSTE